MKKTLLIILIIITVLAVYLNRTYAHIYNLIGEKNLPFPQERHYFVGDKNDKLVKIAFLGDSLTAGVGASSVSTTYPYLIANKSNPAKKTKTQIEVLNLGVPGATSLEVLNNQVSLANNFAPDKVVIFIGINDLHNRLGKDKLEKNIRQIIANLKIDKKNIYLVDIPYLGDKQSFVWPWQKYFLYQTKKYNQTFNGLNSTGINLIDIFSPTYKSFLNNSFWYASDNLHPNDQGYQLIAATIYYYLNYDNSIN